MKQILVVDDDPAVRKLVAEALQGQYVITVASNGAEALDSMRQRLPDAVVLDIAMPVMNGWSFLAACRGQPRYAHVPVVVVSAELAACEDGQRRGAQACVRKPFDLDTLAAAMDQLFHGTTPSNTDEARGP